MNIGDLEDSLLKLGKEKGKEVADNYLEEHEAQGGLLGKGFGLGQQMLDNALGSDRPEYQSVDGSQSEAGAEASAAGSDLEPDSVSGPEANPSRGDSDSEPNSSSDDSGVDDNEDDGSARGRNDDRNESEAAR